ncbi:MAG: hypothetical protein K1Y02_05670 [Candidatus Hydrogenedentes bacterium]|nr:hypothetical protein [Candidatus Hydrogenedentota bacterium]
MRLRKVWVGVVACVVLASCQTPSKPAPPPPIEASYRFEPAWGISTIHAGEGRYPDLFGGGSRAIWLDSHAVEVKKAASKAPANAEPGLDSDALAIADAYIVIECRLESQFADMSVAYDAVRLRGITAHLELPDGTTIAPIQSRSFGPVEEEPTGALKVFRRATVFIFPKSDLFKGVPAIGADSIAVKLVLEGIGSKYYFEWPGISPGVPAWRAPTPEEAIYYGRLSYYELFSEIRRVAHIFD